MSYEAFKDEDGNEFGSFEVFWADDLECPGCGDCDGRAPMKDPGHVLESGWYWWACFPGCLPDGEPSGPFETEQAAIEDAQGQG